MKYHVSKLDSRFTGAQWFYCRAQLMSHGGEDKIFNYVTLRNWCWETFGPSCEVDLVRRILNHKDVTVDFAPKWAWKRDDSANAYYIYLTETAYTAFTLKWASQ